MSDVEFGLGIGNETVVFMEAAGAVSDSGVGLVLLTDDFDVDDCLDGAMVTGSTSGFAIEKIRQH